MRSTLSKLLLVPAIAAAAALLSQTAKAETLQVPFSFSVMGKTFPAGEYKVATDQNANFVTLELTDGSRSITRILGPGSPEPRDHRVVLRFETTGSNYSLESIQFGGSITPNLIKHSHRTEEASRGTRMIVGG
ncbi:MAG TPA: hypothetical protein VGL22_12520 [Terracidiphilus sp.]|jgi:hypothetical protein